MVGAGQLPSHQHSIGTTCHKKQSASSSVQPSLKKCSHNTSASVGCWYQTLRGAGLGEQDRADQLTDAAREGQGDFSALESATLHAVQITCNMLISVQSACSTKERGCGRTLGEQLGVRAALDNDAIFDNGDGGSGLDGGEAVRDNYHCAACLHSFQRLLHQRLALRVQRARRLRSATPFNIVDSLVSFMGSCWAVFVPLVCLKVSCWSQWRTVPLEAHIPWLANPHNWTTVRKNKAHTKTYQIITK